MKRLRAAAIITAAVFSLCSTTLTACARKSGEPADPRKGPVVASVNGRKIHQREVDLMLMIMKQRDFRPDSTTAGANLDAQRRNFAINTMIDRALILDDASRRGITPDTAQVNRMMAPYKAQFAKTDTLPGGLTEADIRENLSDDMMINSYIQKTIVDSITVSEEELKAFYDGHPDQFSTEGKIHARHILVAFKPDATQADKDAAKVKAEGILLRAQKGEDFAKLAGEYSDDPGSKAQGGDLPPFSRGSMVKEFEDAAFALSEGQISGVVKSDFGYHIIKREKVEPMTLDKVRPQLTEYLKSQKKDAFQSMFDGRLAALKATAKIVRPEEKKS